MIGSTEKRKGTAAGFLQAEERVVDRDVFEAKALGWYLKT